MGKRRWCGVVPSWQEKTVEVVRCGSLGSKGSLASARDRMRSIAQCANQHKVRQAALAGSDAADVQSKYTPTAANMRL